MTDIPDPTFGSLIRHFRQTEDASRSPEADRYVREALERNKREGLVLAVKTRWIALAAVGALTAVLNWGWDQIYYEALLLGFALIGWAQLRLGRAGRSPAELFLMFCDLSLLTFMLLVPNPFSDETRPLAMQYRFDGFIYFFVLLAGGTISYSWRTIVAMGTWTTGVWMTALVIMLLQPVRFPELSTAAAQAFAGFPELIRRLDPNAMEISNRIQEVVVFLIVASVLALGVRRANHLVLHHVAVERERANLARYFSPNVVEDLARNDQSLKQVRSQKIAVLFVDIVGFTSFAEGRDPVDIIRTLRDFHGFMETEVFRHEGTLDKYLGDGLMATFGTPIAGGSDASNALRCARAMLRAGAEWNRARAGRGEPQIAIGVGLHYGDAVLGDIGTTRLEFAVIGSTVNVASRLEGMTRSFGVPLVVSDDLLARVHDEARCGGDDIAGFEKRPAQMVRGLAHPLDLWTLDAGVAAGTA